MLWCHRFRTTLSSTVVGEMSSRTLRSLFSCDASENLLQRAAYGKHRTRTALSTAVRPAASSRALDAASIAGTCSPAHRHHERRSCPRATERRVILQFAGPFTIHHPEDPEDIPFITLASPLYGSWKLPSKLQNSWGLQTPSIIGVGQLLFALQLPKPARHVAPSWSVFR